MKVLADYYSQARPYADSYGKCVVQIESGDDADAIIKDYTRERDWYEEEYSNPVRVNHYEHKLWNGQVKSFDGDLIVFNTHRTYLD